MLEHKISQQLTIIIAAYLCKAAKVKETKGLKTCHTDTHKHTMIDGFMQSVATVHNNLNCYLNVLSMPNEKAAAR